MFSGTSSTGVARRSHRVISELILAGFREKVKIGKLKSSKSACRQAEQQRNILAYIS